MIKCSDCANQPPSPLLFFLRVHCTRDMRDMQNDVDRQLLGIPGRFLWKSQWFQREMKRYHESLRNNQHGWVIRGLIIWPAIRLLGPDKAKCPSSEKHSLAAVYQHILWYLYTPSPPAYLYIKHIHIRRNISESCFYRATKSCESSMFVSRKTPNYAVTQQS